MAVWFVVAVLVQDSRANRAQGGRGQGGSRCSSGTRRDARGLPTSSVDLNHAAVRHARLKDGQGLRGAAYLADLQRASRGQVVMGSSGEGGHPAQASGLPARPSAGPLMQQPQHLNQRTRGREGILGRGGGRAGTGDGGRAKGRRAGLSLLGSWGGRAPCKLTQACSIAMAAQQQGREEHTLGHHSPTGWPVVRSNLVRWAGHTTQLQ